MTKCANIIGEKFGRLTVISRVENNKRGNANWLCRCDCGKEIFALTNSLHSGNTKSCGCIVSELIIKRNRVHGLLENRKGVKPRLYNIWIRMKQRCNNKNSSDSSLYCERGIKVCEEWEHSYKAFYNWSISNGYRDNLTIDRIDNDGNYKPLNCRWASLIVQARNRRTNHLITYMGNTKTLVEWSETSGIKSATLRQRIKNGTNIENLFKEIKGGLKYENRINGIIN